MRGHMDLLKDRGPQSPLTSYWLSRKHEDYLDWLENHQVMSAGSGNVLPWRRKLVAMPLQAALWLAIALATAGVVVRVMLP